MQFTPNIAPDEVMEDLLCFHSNDTSSRAIGKIREAGFPLFVNWIFDQIISCFRVQHVEKACRSMRSTTVNRGYRKSLKFG